MSLKEVIKNKICLVSMTPNYPLRNFIGWADSIDIYLLLHYLEDIQKELDQEKEFFLRSTIPLESHTSSSEMLHHYWCFYCSQIRAYYRAVIRNPSTKEQMNFLL